jgi:hypothetical protein
VFSLHLRGGVAKTCQAGTFLLKPRTCRLPPPASGIWTLPSALAIQLYRDGEPTESSCQWSCSCIMGLASLKRENCDFLPLSLGNILFFAFPCVFLFCSGIATIGFVTPCIIFIYLVQIQLHKDRDVACSSHHCARRGGASLVVRRE